MNVINSYYKLSIEKTLLSLKTRQSGLTTKEVNERVKLFGLNKFSVEEKNPALKIFLSQFNNFLMYILIIATTISFVVGEVLDAFIIGLIILASGVLGFIQEYRSQEVLAALKKLASFTANVFRNGLLLKIAAEELVPGDIIKLNWGDKIPADARIIKELDLEISEAVLTGESQPVKKSLELINKPNVVLAERFNMVYSGTVVTRGHGEAVVVATGNQSEFGKIANLLSSVEQEKTPLEIKLSGIGKILGFAAIVVCFAAVFLGILRGYPPLEMFIWGVSLAVAAVPEALPAVVTASLSLGVWEMAKKKAIVRRLPAVETLGSISVICSDKTGTLTKNEMTVKELYLYGNSINLTGSGYLPEGNFIKNNKVHKTGKDPDLKLLLKIGLLCNDAVLEKKNEEYLINGDPTEGALVVAAAKAGFHQKQMQVELPRIAEIPFDMSRKSMSTFHKEGKEVWMLVKGAPESVLPLCNRIQKSNQISAINIKDKQIIIKKTELMAEKAVRVLAFAYKKIPSKDFPVKKKLTATDWENKLIFVGLMGMIDPPRIEAKQSIVTCLKAGIKPIIITGDHALTALAVGREVGLLRSATDILTSEELNKLSAAELLKVVDKKSYARVTPADKLKIIEALKQKNHIVAMTGDGVNDAPALKKADIGVAMGIAGTDVAKEAADMILAGDNFATIVSAIKKGREIYDNIKKYLFYLLRCNVGEILVLGGGFLFGLPPVLSAIQILWINLVTDGLPALALGIDPSDEEVMTRKPVNATKSIFSFKSLALMVILAISMAVVLLPEFSLLITTRNLIRTQTVIFATMVFIEMINAFNSRSDKSLFKINIFENKWLNLAVLSSLGATFIIIQVPFFSRLFGTVSLSGGEWLLALILSLSAFLTSETAKLFLNRTKEQ